MGGSPEDLTGRRKVGGAFLVAASGRRRRGAVSYDARWEEDGTNRIEPVCWLECVISGNAKVGNFHPTPRAGTK
jgi:hypothetical protein